MMDAEDWAGVISLAIGVIIVGVQLAFWALVAYALLKFVGVL